MSTPVSLPFTPSGPLDTVNPIADRPLGTLIEAVNTATRWMGPRRGSLRLGQTRNIDAEGDEPRPIDALYRFTGGTEFISGPLFFYEQFNLPNIWTMDLVFSPEDTPGNSTPRVFTWEGGTTTGAVRIIWHSSSSGTPQVMQVEVDTLGAGNNHVMVGTLPVFPDIGTQGQYHIRIVRIRTVLAFFVNGTLDQSITIEDKRHQQLAGNWRIGDVSGVPRFTGKVQRVVVRRGAIFDSAQGYSDFMFPMNDDVLLYVHGGRQIASTTAGAPNYYTRDYSRFGANGVLTGAPDIVAVVEEPPFRQPVQLMTSFTDQKARRWNVFMIGGTLFWNTA